METKEVFDKVASKYDIMNDIMSLGAHRYLERITNRLAFSGKGDAYN